MTRSPSTLILALILAFPGASGAIAPLDRNPASYFAIGTRSARLKDLTLVPGCNVGVNCPKPPTKSGCGTLRGKGLTIGAPGQVAADDLCAPGASPRSSGTTPRASASRSAPRPRRRFLLHRSDSPSARSRDLPVLACGRFK
jgi:hypothetical protein